jgi:hypothetical protein
LDDRCLVQPDDAVVIVGSTEFRTGVLVVLSKEVWAEMAMDHARARMIVISRMQVWLGESPAEHQHRCEQNPSGRAMDG